MKITQLEWKKYWPSTGGVCATCEKGAFVGEVFRPPDANRWKGTVHKWIDGLCTRVFETDVRFGTYTEARDYIGQVISDLERFDNKKKEREKWDRFHQSVKELPDKEKEKEDEG